MQPAVLLGLLGAAVVAVVSSMPADNRNHNEEMVTRCIIEVLSNALSKSNTPPITPECREVLKKNGKEVKDEEKSENENTRFEVRLLRDPVDVSEAHKPSGREEAGAPGEEDPQGPTMVGTEGGGHSREGVGELQGSLYPSDNQVSKEAKTRHSEKSEGEDREEEEREKYQKRENGEDGSKEQHLEEPGEIQNAFLNQRNQATAKKKEELVSRYDTHSVGGLEEKTHSRERSSQESGEETRKQEKRPREPKSQPRSQEESEESEEDASPEVDKRRLRPRHHHGRTRPDRSSQEGNPPSEERGHPREESEESNMDIASLGEKRDHHLTQYKASEEEPEYGEEVRSYPAVQAPADLEGGRHGGRGSEEYRAPRPPSEENQEEEDKRNRPSSEVGNMAHGYSEESEEERGPEGGRHHRARGGQPAYSTPDTKEKRFLGEGHHRVQESQMDKARRHPQGELRNYLNYGEEKGEEGAQGKWQQQDLQDTKENREEARLQGKQYAPHHTTEKRKRLGVLLNPYYAPRQWESSRFERKANVDDSFLEGEEENGLTLNEKNFFPEYNYDWWEKKPLEEDVNWEYEKRNLAPKLDLKRQYDRVAELDQLLHYRKKSAEFPDFYDSEEQMTPRHTAENEKDRAGQGVLTEEEEKELENLAAMDLELQKIAEKFSGNRRG
ncbi:PREDICTED: secretogranin-1 [Ceratotherium simum simum]|uniref:Secretogranin-1 n=1 Tax=Ceratotherium simum simum TaxID=73337 RepID=A0ABM0HTS0_CERSS|nr:PREDICTED: secretogranin-1 [Ceratotherium simum simum]